MAMEEALIARLKAAAGVSVMADGPGRITYFERTRAAGLPAISVLTVSVDDGWTHDGPTGLDWVRMRIDSWASTRSEAIALKSAVREEMQQARDVDGIRFHPARRDAERSIDEGEQDGGDPLFRVSQDYTFYHEEL